MRISRTLVMLIIAILACTAAYASDITANELEKALLNNPHVLIEAIKANRKAIFNIINQTGVEEQARMRKEAEEAEKQAYEDTFKNPLKPAIDNKTRMRGTNDAKYTLVSMRTFSAPTARPATRPSMS